MESKLVGLAAFTMILVEQPVYDGPKPYNDMVLKCLYLPFIRGSLLLVSIVTHADVVKVAIIRLAHYYSSAHSVILQIF